MTLVMKKVVPHNHAWKDLYALESEALSNLLGPILVTSHHIGSTAIPDLLAKPIIDILLEVTSLSQLDKRSSVLETYGYDPRGEYGISGRRYYSKKTVGQTSGYHVHAYEVGHHEVQRHLAFRDYLIEKPKIAAEYAKIKRQLIDKEGVLMHGYQDSKKPWVDAISKEALDHFANEA